MSIPPVILTFSHLRWEDVFQRPQHLLSRLARANRRVIFIEEPILDSSSVLSWDISEPSPNVVVAKPRTPESAGGFNEKQLAHLRRMLPGLLAQLKVTDYVAWFYTPLPVTLLDGLSPKAVVHDCMDELSKFLYAPKELLQREEELFAKADVVFTGGASLYKAKRHRHSNIHCFPSSVDVDHFRRATAPEDPADQRDIPHPRLGYMGVIDERIDLEMLACVAEAHPDWNIIMAGPVVKIDPETLPKYPNIHYLGRKQYADLPAYLHNWDVCLMPFAQNESTRFISPTKTLEYMAVEKMIASTPITDVADYYSDIVWIGATPNEFEEACRHALYVSDSERAKRVFKMRQVLGKTSWDTTVAAMEQLIGDACSKQSPVVDANYSTVVVGAGPTGLSAAYHLGNGSLLVEQNDRVGGWCRSLVDNGFTFDYAGHIMFSNDEYVHQLYRMLLGDNVHWQNREAWIYSKGVHTRYPFQGALYGLPSDVIKECIVGAIEARFGSTKPKANGKGANGHTNGKTQAHCATGDVKDCCADGILESETELAIRHLATDQKSSEPKNFEEFIYKVWGAGIAKHFAIPYNRKLWAVPLTEMETSWLGGRVPLPDLEEMIEGALSPVPKPMGPNARFGYPLTGGFQALMDGFLPHMKADLKLNTKVTFISAKNRTVSFNNGTVVRFDELISTMPLPVLVRLLGTEVPANIRMAADGLRHVSVRCVNIGVGCENITEKHWIYYPEDTIFHRIFVQGNASPNCNPAGGFGLTCEITYSEHKLLPCDGQELIDLCIRDLKRVGMMREDDEVWASNQVDMPYAYVVYDHGRSANVKMIREWLEERGIILAGRYSEWEYYNSDHAFLAGKKAADKVLERRRNREERAPKTLLAGLQSTKTTIYS